MPLPSALGAPFFNRTNITKFLRTISAMYRRAKAESEGNELVYLKDYCLLEVEIQLESLEEYQNRDYIVVTNKIWVEYADRDYDQQKFNT